jgi:hypothetical protein
VKELGRYDSEMQMFVKGTFSEPDLKYLIHLRKLAEAGKLEHIVAGPPNGDVAARALLTYMMPIEAIVREGIPNKTSIQDHIAKTGDY